MPLSITEHTPHTAAPPTVVTHLRDLLPLQKRAVFHVKLVIHQLQSVPLVSGEFMVKWKFRHLQTVNSAGRPLGLGRALAHKLDGQKKKRVEHKRVIDNGKGKEVAHGEKNEVLVQVSDTSTTLPLPLFPNGQSDSTHSDRPQSKQSTSSSTSASISNYASTSSTLNTLLSEDMEIDYRTQAKGHTPFLPLSDFEVDFESEVNVAVQMSIERESLALQSSELKLTVMQRVIPNDPAAPLNPRLGHVEVNLAEYVGAGPVTRNYLLRRSKVNAMLNMTITMTQISGEESYRAPPLRKEEIKAGISDFLSASNVPLPSLAHHMPMEDPWLSSSFAEFVHLDEDGILISQVDEPEEIRGSTPELPEPLPRHRKRWRVGAGKQGSPSSRSKTLDTLPPPKADDASSQKQQLHPTEALIEAIFNPYPSTSGRASPFTYYAPPPPLSSNLDSEQRGMGSGTPEGNGTDGTSRGSFDSSLRVSASDQGHEGENSSGSGRGRRWWQRKASSRSVTPARTNSTRS